MAEALSSKAWAIGAMGRDVRFACCSFDAPVSLSTGMSSRFWLKYLCGVRLSTYINPLTFLFLPDLTYFPPFAPLFLPEKFKILMPSAR